MELCLVITLWKGANSITYTQNKVLSTHQIELKHYAYQNCSEEEQCMNAVGEHFNSIQVIMMLNGKPSAMKVDAVVIISTFNATWKSLL